MNRSLPILFLAPAFWACSGDKSDDTGTSPDGDTTDTDTDGGGGDTDTDGGGGDTDTDGQATTDVAVFINEVMSSNATVLKDETGAYPDWVEIWNGTGADLDLSGWFLTDDDSWTDKWAFPPGTTVAANGYLVVYCDGDVLDGPLHTSFKLKADGEYLGIYSPLDEGNALADETDYPLSAIDVSWARQPDGGEFADDDTPTPGGANL